MVPSSMKGNHQWRYRCLQGCRGARSIWNKRSLRVRHIWCSILIECQTAPLDNCFHRWLSLRNDPGIPFLSAKTSGMLGFFVSSHWNLFILLSSLRSILSVQSLLQCFLNPSWYWSSWHLVQLIQQWGWEAKTSWSPSICRQFHSWFSYVNCLTLIWESIQYSRALQTKNNSNYPNPFTQVISWDHWTNSDSLSCTLGWPRTGPNLL